MPSFLVSCALSIAVVHQTMALSYWIDGSCTGPREMSDIVKETISMGDRASSRLSAASDTDFASVYEFLMKRPKSDTAQFNTINGFLSDVGKMTPAADQKSSNIRIYCDDERRWTPRVDPKTKQNTGGWEDVSNWIVYHGRSRLSTPGCHDLRGGSYYTWAQTYQEKMPGNPPEPQNDLRATVTICDKSFYDLGTDNKPKGDPKKGIMLSKLKATVDLTKLDSIDTFALHISKIMLHELSHFSPYGTIDNAYFWTKKHDARATLISTISADELMKNADVRAYIGQMALIADRGFTIQRPPPDDASKEDKDAFTQSRSNGKLFKYENLTKRSLQNRMAKLGGRFFRGRRQDRESCLFAKLQ